MLCDPTVPYGISRYQRHKLGEDALVASRSSGPSTGSSLLSPDTIQSRDTVLPRASINIDLKGRVKSPGHFLGLHQLALRTYLANSRPALLPPSPTALRPPLLALPKPTQKRFIHSHTPRSSSSSQDLIPADWIAPDPSPFLPAGCGATPSAPLATRRSKPPQLKRSAATGFVSPSASFSAVPNRPSSIIIHLEALCAHVLPPGMTLFSSATATR